MAYLIDTNVISELRKAVSCNLGVRKFFDQADEFELFLPVQVIGDIRSGISKVRRQKEHTKAQVYEQWLETLLQEYGNRIVESGGKKDPHTIDKQIAAIAMIRDMTLVTRDSGGGFATIGQGLKVLNPFATGAAAQGLLP